MYSSSTCPCCKKARDAIEATGAMFTVVELDQEDDGMATKAELIGMTGQSTVPQVFIGGEFVGGCNDGGIGGVLPLRDSGKLEPMLSASHDLDPSTSGLGALCAALISSCKLTPSSMDQRAPPQSRPGHSCQEQGFDNGLNSMLGEDLFCMRVLVRAHVATLWRVGVVVKAGTFRSHRGTNDEHLVWFRATAVVGRSRLPQVRRRGDGALSEAFGAGWPAGPGVFSPDAVRVCSGRRRAAGRIESASGRVE